MSCERTRSLLLLGSNPSDEGVLPSDCWLIPLCPSDHEGVRANIPWLIPLCPSDREGVRARSLECVHQLMGFYPRSKEHTL